MKYIEIKSKDQRREISVQIPRKNTWRVHLGVWLIGIGAWIMGEELELHN